MKSVVLVVVLSIPFFIVVPRLINYPRNLYKGLLSFASNVLPSGVCITVTRILRCFLNTQPVVDNSHSAWVPFTLIHSTLTCSCLNYYTSFTCSPPSQPSPNCISLSPILFLPLYPNPYSQNLPKSIYHPPCFIPTLSLKCIRNLHQL